MQKANGQQAERIKELEAELERERLRLAACGSAALGYFDGCKDEYKSASLDDVLRLREQLAALHQRIDDAPVVAWCVAYDTIHGTRIHSDPSMYEPKVDAHVERCEGRISKVALISKEDLQK